MEENISGASERQSLVPGLKSVCTRLGVMMIIVFGVRIGAELLLGDLLRSFSGDAFTLMNSLYAIVFLNLVPITAAVLLLKFPIKSGAAKIYAKPKYFGRALGIFPAGYGVAIFIAFLTALAGMLFSRGTGIGDSFHATDKFIEYTGIGGVLINLIHAVVFAPILEEFWFRGVVMESLRPYGNGFAIFVSALLFGITHANFSQVFYATAIGIIFGYVAVQTGSILTSMALHAMFNTPASLMRFFMTDEATADALANMVRGEPYERTTGVVLYYIWSGIIIIVAIVGVISAVVKFTRIKRYRVPKVQDELTARRRWGILLTRASFIIMLIPAAYVFFRLTPQKLAELFGG